MRTFDLLTMNEIAELIRPVLEGIGDLVRRITVLETARSERLAYSRSEAADIIGVSWMHVEKYVRSGDLKARRMGTRILVTREDLLDFLRSLPPVERDYTP